MRHVFIECPPLKSTASAYNPYGYIARQASLLSLLGLNGEVYDPLSKFYALGNGYRSYNPALMRFIAPDSLSPFAEGGPNAYAYCAGDPINHVDPTGHVNLNELLLKRNQILNKTTSPKAQKIDVKKAPARTRSKISKTPADTPSTKPETLQLSAPRRHITKTPGSSILSNPALRENTYENRKTYYLFVDKAMSTEALSEKLFLYLHTRAPYLSQAKIRSAKSELARVDYEAGRLRATAIERYPYTFSNIYDYAYLS